MMMTVKIRSVRAKRTNYLMKSKLKEKKKKKKKNKYHNFRDKFNDKKRWSIFGSRNCFWLVVTFCRVGRYFGDDQGQF